MQYQNTYTHNSMMLIHSIKHFFTIKTEKEQAINLYQKVIKKSLKVILLGMPRQQLKDVFMNNLLFTLCQELYG